MVAVSELHAGLEAAAIVIWSRLARGEQTVSGSF